MASVVSYADKNYQQKKALYDVLAQVFQDWKYGVVHTNNSWSLPVQEIQGATLRLVGEGHLELTYHHYEVTTVEGLARQNLTKDGQRFIDEMMKSLRKEFEEVTGKQLKVKKIKEDQALDKTSRISAETSWMLGSSRYGFGARPVGRYLVRDSAVFEFSANL